MPKSQKEMNHELMDSIYKNLQTAKQSINNVIEKISDSKLKRELKSQFKDYDELSESCEDLARVYEIDISDTSFFTKARMWMTINFSTLLDRSNTKIASINIIGSTMGVIDLMKVLSDCKKCKKELLTLGKAVLSLEERNIEKLKPYILNDSEKQKEPSADEEQEIKKANKPKKKSKRKPQLQENNSQQLDNQ